MQSVLTLPKGSNHTIHRGAGGTQLTHVYLLCCCCRYTGEVHVTLIATGFPDNFEENLLTMTMGKGARQQAASNQQQAAMQ